MFKNRLYNLKAYRKDREELRDAALENPLYFKEVINLAFDLSNKSHYKACWVLELICEKQLEAIFPYLDRYCDTLSLYNNESAIRPIAKIMVFLIHNYHKKLSESQIQQFIETSFDWLISDTKVAAKAYAMEVLFELGKHHQWIHQELKQIITQDYSKHSAGYKARARMILKEINH